MNELTAANEARVELLRRLAGRISDRELAALRADLREREIRELERNLLGYLTEHTVPLREAELDLLRAARLRPDGPWLAELASWDGVTPLPEYRFEPAAADGSSTERHVLDWARDPRRILKALRLPASADALPESVVYVVEFAAGVDVSLQVVLSQVETVAAGEELPPYQAAALAAGRRIWPVG